MLLNYANTLTKLVKRYINIRQTKENSIEKTYKLHNVNSVNKNSRFGMVNTSLR